MLFSMRLTDKVLPKIQPKFFCDTHFSELDWEKTNIPIISRIIEKEDKM